MPPIRLSYHRGSHYNALIDPWQPTIGAGLGFGKVNIDKDRVKATIEAMQDQQIDNALLAEGRFYPDLELTEKELERMALEVSRAEYLADGKCKKQIGFRGSSSTFKPSSSGSTAESNIALGDWKMSQPYRALGSAMQMMLYMGFSYLQAFEASAYSGMTWTQ